MLGGVGVEERAEFVAELVSEVWAEFLHDPATLVEQCSLLDPQLLLVETGWVLGVAEQRGEQLLLLCGKVFPGLAHRVIAVRIAVSSAASSPSLGKWSSRSSRTPGGDVRACSCASRSRTSGRTGWAWVSW